MSGEKPKQIIEAQPQKQLPEAELDSSDFFTEIAEQVGK
jgi:hypothetical protein